MVICIKYMNAHLEKKILQDYETAFIYYIVNNTLTESMAVEDLMLPPDIVGGYHLENGDYDLFTRNEVWAMKSFIVMGKKSSIQWHFDNVLTYERKTTVPSQVDAVAKGCCDNPKNSYKIKLFLVAARDVYYFKNSTVYMLKASGEHLIFSTFVLVQAYCHFWISPFVSPQTVSPQTCASPNLN